MPSTIDITGFLKLFQQDGNPAATKLSPVRKRVNIYQYDNHGVCFVVI